MADLCTMCLELLRSIVSAAPDESFVFDHHRSAIEFHQSVDSECYICSHLSARIREIDHESLERTGPEDKPLNIGCRVRKPDVKEARLFSLHFSRLWEHETHESRIGIFRVFSGKSIYCRFRKLILCLSISELEPLMSRFAVENDPALRCSLAQARNWLTTCLCLHTECWQVSTEQLPSRLIELRKIDNQLTICLRNCSQLSSHTKYFTLSHCWGKTPMFKLLQNNIEQLMNAIPISELSPLFRDAIHITLELGYRYIWIDSLCIIQDDPDNVDWLRHCSKMHHIYGNAVCTLSATGFSDGSCGLLPTANSLPRIYAKFETALTEAFPAIDNRTELLSDDPGADSMYVTIFAPDTPFVPVDGPLKCRGWVLQEQILSQRILHFSQDQLAWECRRKAVSEFFPEEDPEFEQKVSFMRTYSTRSLKERQMSKKSLYFLWQQLMMHYYSTMSLTVPNDKLPAVAGIANRFKELLEDIYLAGLWLGDLINGLLWRGTWETTFSTEYRAPSWSWASVDGFCISHDRNAKETMPLVTILQAKVQHASDDITSKVTSGFICFKCLLKANFDTSQADEARTAVINYDFGPHTSSDDMEFFERELIDDMNPDLVIYPTYKGSLSTRLVSLMPLKQGQGWRPECYSDEKILETSGLVLHQTQSRGEYIKIGIFIAYGEQVYERLFLDQMPLAEPYYKEFDGERYTIHVV